MTPPEITGDIGKCHVCGAIKPFPEGFQKTSCKKGWGTPWGGAARFYKHICRRCYAEKKKTERDGNKEHFLELERARYYKNRAVMLARSREYRDRNKTVISIKAKKYRTENLAYRASQAAYKREWINKPENRVKARLYVKARRARISLAPVVETITQRQIDNLFVKQRGRCAACKKPMTLYHMDHIKPLAKGGEHTIRNMQLLHPECNIRKADHDPVMFMQKLGFLL